MDNLKAGDLYNSNEFLYTASDIVEGDSIYNRIINKSYVPNDYIGLDDLVYLKFLHYDYDGNTKVGELIVNKIIKDKTIDILKKSFENKIQFNSFKLVDDYFITDDDDRTEIDNRSIADNNSYGFFYRKIYGTERLSNHSYGCAIDINPRENPYLPYRNGEYDYTNLTELDKKYLHNREESDNPHIITQRSPIYKIFKSQKFEWGGDWEHTKDYQHYEAEYATKKTL